MNAANTLPATTLDRQLALIDYVKDALIKQNAQSSYADAVGITLCQYRGPNGTKCAIGHLIPDEMYDPVFESKSGEYLTGLSHHNYTNNSDRIRAETNIRKFQPVLDHIMRKFGLTNTRSTSLLLRDVQFIHDAADSDIKNGESYADVFKRDYDKLKEKYSSLV